MRRSLDEFDSYLRWLAHIELKRLGETRLSASDLAQETMLRAHQRFEQFRGASSAELAGWLRVILRNLLVDAARRLGREVDQQSLAAHLDESSARLQTLLVDDQPTPQTVGRRREDELHLTEALLRLPEAQREAIELRYFQGLSLSEITRRMNRSPASVGGLLQRGLAALRDEMQK